MGGSCSVWKNLIDLGFFRREKYKGEGRRSGRAEQTSGEEITSVYTGVKEMSRGLGLNAERTGEFVLWEREKKNHSRQNGSIIPSE